jgi:hypothetical protein
MSTFILSAQDPTTFQKYESCGVAQSGLDGSSFVEVLKLAKSLDVRVILDLHQVEGSSHARLSHSF